MKRYLLLCAISAGLLLTSGCLPTYQTYQSEIVSSRVQNKIEDRLEKENPDIEHQNIDLLGKTAAFFFIFKDDKVPQNIQNELEGRVYNTLRETGFYPDLKHGKQIASLLKKHLVLNQLKSIYLDSISTVAVSDKDISNPLGKVLNAENFLIFQIDTWPDTDETKSDVLKMKMRVVNSDTGNILWTALHVMEKFSVQPGTPEEKINYVTDTLTQSFYDRFRSKWHKKRFINLAKI